MDFVNKLTGSSDEQKTDQQSSGDNNSGGSGGGGFFSGISDKLNTAAGGGKQSEDNEDALDKAVDWGQKTFQGAGDQSNESAAEQFKDEQISDFIRDKYKSTTGSDLPIADKEKDYGT